MWKDQSTKNFQRSASWSHAGFQNMAAHKPSAAESSIGASISGNPVRNTSLHYTGSFDNGSARLIPASRYTNTTSEHSQRLVAFGFNLTSSLTDAIIVYPCLVLRRRCQVSSVGRRYHLMPITILEVAIKLQRSQGVSCIWKGVGSHLILNVISFAVESGISELTENLPMDVNRHSKVKDFFGHIALKALSAALIMPFFSAHLVESVQSEAASESSGIFYFIVEGFSRLVGYAGIQSHRLLPFRHLLIPTVLYFVSRYVLSNVLEFSILGIFRYKEKQKHEFVLSTAHPFSPVDKEALAFPKSNISTTKAPVHLHMTKNACFESHYHEFLSKFFAGFVTDVILYPFETALFRLYVQGTRTIIDDMDRGAGFLPVSSHHEGYVDCFNAVKTNEGVSGLFRGFGSLLLQYSMRFCVFKFIHLISLLRT